MTTLATALALVPLVIAGNVPGHEIEHPLAIVVLGGLVTSTLLNLLRPAVALPAFRPARRLRGAGRACRGSVRARSCLG